MKIGTFVAFTAVAMTATSAAVWSLAAPAAAPASAAPVSAVAPAGSVAPAGTPLAASGPVASSSVTPASAAPAIDVSQAAFQVGGTLTMEGRLGHPVLPTAGANETFVFVDVVPASGQRAKVRAPLDLSIVIDRSGSMRGKRLRNAVAAARTAIGRLRDGDTVSVVTYDTRTALAVPQTTLTPASRIRIMAAIEAIRARGNTCISCGLQAGMQSLAQVPGRISKILLLSDGEATAGVRTEDGFRRIAENCRTMGASITSIGVDVEYNQRIMATLARNSNGRHFFVENASTLPAIFDQEMDRLSRTVATDAELVVDLAPGVFVAEVYDRGFRRDGTSRLVVPLGGFADSERKTFLARLRVPGGIAGARAVADIRLGYRDLLAQAPTRSQGRLVVHLSGDASTLTPLDPLVSARLSQSEAVAALEQANVLAQRGDTAGARLVLDESRRTVENRRQRAARSVASGRRAGLEKNFDRLAGVLGGAADGFADPPAASAAEAEAAPRADNGIGRGSKRNKRFATKPAAPARKLKAQIRANQEDAVELGF